MPGGRAGAPSKVLAHRGSELAPQRALLPRLHHRDLLRFADRPAPPREAPLIVANPAFDDADVPPAPEATRRDVRSIDMVTHALPSLGSTAEEARHIARLFPGSRVLLGAQAMVSSDHGHSGTDARRPLPRRG